MTSKHKNKKAYIPIAMFYLLIAFEFFYMASPFAAYLYYVYQPGLAFIDNYPSLAWLTGFFLPHLVESTQSPIINMIKPTGFVLSCIGLLIFIVSALQIYYAKLIKKGVVTNGLYQYIRHPQYTAFSIFGLGLLMLWPRYLALVMFITMLFVYYFLAKAEERECEKKFGQGFFGL